VLSNASWARPKKGQEYWACKCTCMWQDELGKEHYGQEGGVEFTESSLERCLGHACKAGTHAGTTRNCTGTPKTAARVPAQQGTLTPTSPGGTTATTAAPPRGVNIPGAIAPLRTQ
jgi:hypothetical protein